MYLLKQLLTTLVIYLLTYLLTCIFACVITFLLTSIFSYLCVTLLTHSLCLLTKLSLHLLSHFLTCLRWVFVVPSICLCVGLFLCIHNTSPPLLVPTHWIIIYCVHRETNRRGREGEPHWPCVYCLLQSWYCRARAEGPVPEASSLPPADIKTYYPLASTVFIFYLYIRLFQFSLIQSVNLPCFEFFPASLSRFMSLSLRWRQTSIKGGSESSGVVQRVKIVPIRTWQILTNVPTYTSAAD